MNFLYDPWFLDINNKYNYDHVKLYQFIYLLQTPFTMGSYILSKKDRKNRPIAREQHYIAKMYFMARLFLLYVMLKENIIDNYVPSFWIHFKQFPFVKEVKIMGIALHFLVNFCHFGFHSSRYVDNGQVLKKELDMNTFQPRDIFEYTYYLIDKIC